MSTTELIAELNNFGEYVKTPSSTIEEPVAVRFAAETGRQRDQSLRTTPRQVAAPDSDRAATVYPTSRPIPLPPPPLGVRRKRREWYRGEKPSDFTCLFLDEIVIPRRRHGGSVPPDHIRYFEDEVKDAQAIAGDWAPALLEGMNSDEIVDWVGYREMPVKVDQAVKLHQAGVRPEDVNWNISHAGQPSLRERLCWGNLTVDGVIAEVERIRASAEGA